MRAYLIKRLLLVIPTLFVITLVTYAMMRAAPGDPTRAQLLGGEAAGGASLGTGKDRETPAGRALRQKYHLDKPAVVGYAYWLWGVITRADFGTSIVVDPGRPVVRLIGDRLPTTLKLNVWAILLAYLCAVPIGVYSATHPYTLTDRAATVVLFVFYSLPSFWVGLLLITFLCGGRYLDIFPLSGIAPDSSRMWGHSFWWVLGQTARHYVLPVFCLTYGGLAGLSRYARVGLMEVLRQDYIRTARAKGLSERTVIYKHALRNGLIPLITLFAGLLPGLIAGSVIVEYLFNIPGMGSLALTALSSRDYPIIMADFTFAALLTLVGILLSDITYRLVDPRITFD